MKKTITNSIKFIVDSNIWIALATVAFYQLTLLQLGESIKLNPTDLFLFFSSLFIYTLFQLIDAKQKKSLFSKLVVGLSFIVLLACIPYLSYTTLVILMLSGLLTFLYATPLLSLGKTNFNLRKIWFLKSIIVALVWTLSCAVIPLLEKDASSHQLLWFSLEKFLFILGITIPYDIKDLKVDRQEKGMTSFVMKFGIQKTKWFSNFILLIGFVLAYFLYEQNIVEILIPYLFAVFVNSRLEEHTSVYWFTFLIDASIILYFLVYYLFPF